MKLYRFTHRNYANYDPWGDYPSGHTTLLDLEVYDVIKETPKGFWIEERYGFAGQPRSKTWVNNYSRKRFAYPTIEEAKESFKARKARHRRILESKINDIESALRQLGKY